MGTLFMEVPILDLKSEHTGKTKHKDLGSTCKGEGCIRLRTPKNCGSSCSGLTKWKLVFRAYPIAVEPEDFRYLDHEQTVVRLKDGRTFDSLEDFICYAFQCGAEGYPRTEYIDVTVDSTSFSSANFFGVTSSSSSSAMNSRHCSKDIGRGGVNLVVISAVEERILVKRFFLQTLIFRSPGREFSPTIMPS